MTACKESPASRRLLAAAAIFFIPRDQNAALPVEVGGTRTPDPTTSFKA